MAGYGGDWNASDVVAYDVMRDLARSVIGVLLETEQVSRASEEARALRNRVINVDGRDRTAVDAEIAILRARWSELDRARHD